MSLKPVGFSNENAPPASGTALTESGKAPPVGGNSLYDYDDDGYGQGAAAGGGGGGGLCDYDYDEDYGQAAATGGGGGGLHDDDDEAEVVLPPPEQATVDAAMAKPSVIALLATPYLEHGEALVRPGGPGVGQTVLDQLPPSKHRSKPVPRKIMRGASDADTEQFSDILYELGIPCVDGSTGLIDAVADEDLNLMIFALRQEADAKRTLLRTTGGAGAGEDEKLEMRRATAALLSCEKRNNMTSLFEYVGYRSESDRWEFQVQPNAYGGGIITRLTRFYARSQAVAGLLSDAFKFRALGRRYGWVPKDYAFCAKTAAKFAPLIPLILEQACWHATEFVTRIPVYVPPAGSIAADAFSDAVATGIVDPSKLLQQEEVLEARRQKLVEKRNGRKCKSCATAETTRWHPVSGGGWLCNRCKTR